MKKITPYKSYKYALASLDNGGRFYNLASKAKDGDISSAELAKAAGVFSGKQSMILYLEMSLLNLEEEKRNKVLSHLSQGLKSEYAKFKPAQFTPSEARKKAKKSEATIITGIPTLVDSKTEFNGFIMIPIMTGKTTTFTMIPIIDQYDVYKLKDHESDNNFFIAHNRSSRKLPEQLTTCGGIIKELKTKSEEESATGVFLEMLYYNF